MRQVEISITKKNTVTTAYYYWIHLIAKSVFILQLPALHKFEKDYRRANRNGLVLGTGSRLII